MKKITTLTELAAALGKKTNVKAWEKNGKQRLYFGSYGYNTKKMSTKAYIDLRDGKAFAAAIIDCPSQPSSWIQSQEQEIREQLQKYVHYIVRFFDFGIVGTPVEVAINNAILDAEPVQGYYTEWRNVRVVINSYGKLAQRNRQFAVAFKGTKNSAPRGFVSLSDAAFEILNVVRKGEDMIEPYGSAPDYEGLAAMRAEYLAKQSTNNN